MQQHQRLHLEAQIDVRAGARVGRIEDKTAVVAHGELAEPVHVGGEVAAAETVLAGLDQKTVVPVQGPVVAVRLIAALAPALGDHGTRRIAADGVVPADRVGDDRAEDAAHVGVEAVATRQLERVLALQRVGRVVALEWVGGVVEQHADVGAAGDVDEAQRQAAPHHERPVRATGEFVVASGGTGHAALMRATWRAAPVRCTRNVESVIVAPYTRRATVAAAAGGRSNGDDAGAELERFAQIVGDHEHGHTGLGEQTQHELVHVGADARVEGAEGLVEQQHLGLLDQRLGDGEALLHAAGELRRVLVVGAVEADMGEDLATALVGGAAGGAEQAAEQPGRRRPRGRARRCRAR